MWWFTIILLVAMLAAMSLGWFLIYLFDRAQERRKELLDQRSDDEFISQHRDWMSFLSRNSNGNTS